MRLIRDVSEFLYWTYTTSCGLHNCSGKSVSITEFHDTALCHEIWYPGRNIPEKNRYSLGFEAPPSDPWWGGEHYLRR